MVKNWIYIYLLRIPNRNIRLHFTKNKIKVTIEAYHFDNVICIYKIIINGQMNWQRKKDQVERKESEGIENECIKACLELFKGANYGKILVKITLSFI